MRIFVLQRGIPLHLVSSLSPIAADRIPVRHGWPSFSTAAARPSGPPLLPSQGRATLGGDCSQAYGQSDETGTQSDETQRLRFKVFENIALTSPCCWLSTSSSRSLSSSSCHLTVFSRSSAVPPDAQVSAMKISLSPLLWSACRFGLAALYFVLSPLNCPLLAIRRLIYALLLILQ